MFGLIKLSLLIQHCKKVRDLNNFFNPAILLLHHLPAVVGQVLQLLFLLVKVVPGNSKIESKQF